jgi:hypothetical protein
MPPQGKRYCARFMLISASAGAMWHGVPLAQGLNVTKFV